MDHLPSFTRKYVVRATGAQIVKRGHFARVKWRVRYDKFYLVAKLHCKENRDVFCKFEKLKQTRVSRLEEKPTIIDVMYLRPLQPV